MKDLKTQAISDVITKLDFKDTCLSKHLLPVFIKKNNNWFPIFCFLFLNSYLLNLVALRFIFILFLL